LTRRWSGSHGNVSQYSEEGDRAPENLQLAMRDTQLGLCEKLTLEIIAARLHWKTLTPPTMTGRSGVSHRFDFVATNGEDSLAFDICERLSETDVIKVYTRKLDTGVSACIICLTNKIAERARRLASKYGLKVLRPDNIRSAFSTNG
jgi:hypothetical protein